MDMSLWINERFNMTKEITSKVFVTNFIASVKEYRRQLAETRDDSDAAHYFNPKLKKFLKDHMVEINQLSVLNFDRSFIAWMKMYLFPTIKK